MAAYLHWLKLRNQYVNVMFVVASDEDWNGGLGEEDAYAMLWRVEKHRVMNTSCKRLGYQDSHQIRTIWRHFAFWYNIFALTNAHKVWVKILI